MTAASVAERRVVMAWLDYCAVPCLLTAVLLRSAGMLLQVERSK